MKYEHDFSAQNCAQISIYSMYKGLIFIHFLPHSFEPRTKTVIAADIRSVKEIVGDIFYCHNKIIVCLIAN
jgi:hypothetical protein